MANFGEFRIDVMSIDEALSHLYSDNSKNENHIHFLAASSIVAAHGDRDLIEIFNQGLSLPDGAPLAFVLNCLGFRGGNIRGTDFVRAAILADRGDVKHFFIVSSDATKMAIQEEIRMMNPSFQIAGFIVPEFKESFESDVKSWDSDLREAGAEVVWIGLGTPKQDLISANLSRNFNYRCVAVGAALNFVAGTEREAPKIIRSLGLEWFFRFVLEPRRLWRRYVIGNVVFVLIVIRIVLSSRTLKLREPK